MRINRIELKNFRNHKESSFEFEQGINLILGENGSGKTSILDAIGFALFNMKLRSTAEDTLTINESSGYVKLEFTANDRNTYQVTRKFPSGQVSLNEGGSRKIVTGVNEVYKTVNVLIGNISGNLSLFENVIVASQNRFTSIFDETPAERENVFNSIFGTEIYRQMYKGILKQVCDQYDKKNAYAGAGLETKQSQLKNTDELKKIYDDAGNEYREAEKICTETIRKIDVAESSVRESDNAKSLKEKLQISINGITSQIDDRKKQIETVKSDLKTAEEAAVIETELKPQHDEYEKIKEQQDIITKEIYVLEKVEKEFNKNKDEISKLEKVKAEAEGEVKRLKQQTESDKLSIEEICKEIGKLSETVVQLEKDKVIYQDELSSLIKRKRLFDDLYKKYKQACEESSGKEVLAVRAEEASSGEEILLAEITEYEEENSLLEEMKVKRDSLNSFITHYNTLLTELDDAERELAELRCPYLKEQCKNIENAGSISDYFKPKKNDIVSKISELDAELKEYSDIDVRIKKCGSGRSVKMEQLNALRKNIHEAMRYRKEESECKQSAAEYSLAIAKLFTGISGKDAESIKNDDYMTASAEMQGEVSGISTRISGISEMLHDKHDEYKKREKFLNDTTRRINSAEEESAMTVEQIEAYSNELENRKKTAEEYKTDLLPLTELKRKSAENGEKLKKLEPLDQKYRRAAQKSAEKENLCLRLNGENESINRLLESRRSAIEQQNAVVYSAENHERAVGLYSGLKNELQRVNSRLISLKSAFDIASREMEENKKLEVEIELKSREIDEINRKRDAAITFRENIKILGPYISERRTKMIAAAATVNFQRMTGRGERILWENDEEQYLVSIASSAGKRRYNMLSGGEQVAVALSIRSALASEMTDCRFVIFDEPTINLDAEKREALSLSLYEMLKGLEQALVVTHDATFREMATKVIELEKI